MIPGNANPLLLATAAADGAAAAGVATRSLRFNDDDSSSLSRTVSSSGNLKTYTLSMWVKRSKLGYLYSMLYSTNGTNGIYYSFKNTDKLEFADYYGGSYQFQLITSRVFRDTSAWYHIVVAVDTTQATASDRIKIYINGVQETTFDTSNYPAQNYEGSVNRASIVEYLGDMPAGDGFNGYIADVHLVDGSQLEHTSFGAFDNNGVWQAAAYSGAFGTNGFHLKFDDTSSNAALGTDSSGNDNDFTVNNLVASAPATAKGGFDVVTYTGTGSTRTISGLNFQPDFVWIRQRDASRFNVLFDSVRGANKRLISNSTAAESTQTDHLSAFTSDGFTVQTSANVNVSSGSYVAWAWKAGGTAVSNTDGSITSSVSASTDYGFSIVSYTGNSVNNSTIGHGLNTAPKLIITKNRDAAYNWITYSSVLAATKVLALDTTNTAFTPSGGYYSNVGSSTYQVVEGSANLTNLNNSGDDYIAYCWSEVPGFSSFGSYEGDGDGTGPDVTTGFKPKYVIIKNIDEAAGWRIYDSVRGTSKVLKSNTQDTELTTGDPIVFLSDGFRLTGTSNEETNKSGQTYIYAAFSGEPPGDRVDGLFDAPTNGTQSDTGAGGEVSGNYATLNNITPVGRACTFSNGNLEVVIGTGFNSTNNDGIRAVSTIGMTSGKWYFEHEITGGSLARSNVGVVNNIHNYGYGGNHWVGSGAGDYIVWSHNGQAYNNGSGSSYGDTWTTGDIIGCAFDADNGNMYIYKNGTVMNSGTPSHTGLTNGPYFFIAAERDSNITFNFGARAFAYSAPGGYKALNTASISAATITDGSTAFEARTYTGVSGASSQTGYNFGPDFVWIKRRNTTNNHTLTDSVRGAGYILQSHNTNAEVDNTAYFTAFTSDGYSFGTDGGDTDAAGGSYAAWAWDAGANSNKTYTVKVVSDSGNKYRFDDFGTSAVTLNLEEGSTYVFDQSDSSNSGHPLRFSTTSDGTHNSGSEYTTGVTTTGTPGSAGAKTTIVVASSAPTLYYYCSVHSGMGGQANTNSTAGSSNFDGSIQATVRANQTAGFSIISYQGNSTQGATIGHGLNSTPAFIIAKNRDLTKDWPVFHEDLGYNSVLRLNQNGGAIGWTDTYPALPTSSVFTVGNWNGINSSSYNYIAYCFASVDQFSQFGVYDGNGNVDGPFVALSFRPAFLLLKRTDTTGTWLLYDNKREGYNFNNDPLYPNLDATEGTTDYIDLLSNGFKIRNTHGNVNASGGVYSYAAFASNPFSSNGGLAR